MGRFRWIAAVLAVAVLGGWWMPTGDLGRAHGRFDCWGPGTPKPGGFPGVDETLCIDYPPVPAATIEARDIEWRPDTLVVAVGEIIELRNKGAARHSFAIVGYNDDDPLDLMWDQPVTFTVPPDLRPGVYTFYCALPGHRQAGMEGTLTVVERATPTAATPSVVIVGRVVSASEAVLPEIDASDPRLSNPDWPATPSHDDGASVRGTTNSVFIAVDRNDWAVMAAGVPIGTRTP